MINTVDEKKRERQKNMAGLALTLFAIMLVIIAAYGFIQQAQ